MKLAEPIVALTEPALAKKEGGSVLVLSPAVGVLHGLPGAHAELAAGKPFARLRILDATHPLLLPAGLSGVVVRVEASGTGRDAIPVAYGQAILALAPQGEARAKGTGAVKKPAPGPAADGLPAGAHAVLCPADGVFHRRPRPSEPPYVEVGARVHAGQTLALIEAMKSFSAITYTGAGLPDPAEVLDIRAADASEVRHGQILFVVKEG